MTADPIWAVAATVREPAPLVQAFAAHHLALGAAEVHLFFDDPGDPAMDTLAGMPGVVAVPCDDAHWSGQRPHLQIRRQIANADHAAAVAQADWLLHANADEFLSLRRPLAEELARLGPGDLWLKLPVAERVWVAGQPDAGLFDGAFRLAVPDETDLAPIYGRKSAACLDNGLAGHRAGKGIARLRVGLAMGIHAPHLPGTTTLPPSRQAQHAHILHFDGLTPRHWVEKMRRILADGPASTEADQPPGHQQQIARIRAAGRDDAAALALHGALFHLTLDAAVALDRMQALHYARLGDPGDLTTTLTRESFDAALAAALAHVPCPPP